MGNSVIIIVGAIGGTLITRYLTGVAEDVWLIIAFSLIGIVLSVTTNMIIIRNALRPLYRLRNVVDQIENHQAKIVAQSMANTDPDIYKLAIKIDQLLEKLNKRTTQLAALSERFIYAQEEERLRIARELHDDTSQGLSTLIFSLERITQQHPTIPEDVHTKILDSQELALNTLKELRHIIYGLRPSMLDDLGLIPAIRWYARNCLEEEGIVVEVEAQEMSNAIPDNTKTALYRIVQEAINNIVRHAEANRVIIELLTENQSICLNIHDDGHGFNPQRTSERAVQEEKLGLLGIQERVDQLGGTVEISSSPDSGTSIHVCVELINVGDTHEH